MIEKPVGPDTGAEPRIDCDQAARLQVDALYGEGGAAARNTLDAHLRGCPACAAMGEEIAVGKRYLGERSEILYAPIWLGARVHLVIAGSVPKEDTPRSRPRETVDPVLVVASLSLLALLLGAFALSLGESTAFVLDLLPRTISPPRSPASWGLINLILGCALGAFASLLACPLLLHDPAGNPPFGSAKK